MIWISCGLFGIVESKIEDEAGEQSYYSELHYLFNCFNGEVVLHAIVRSQRLTTNGMSQPGASFNKFVFGQIPC